MVPPGLRQAVDKVPRSMQLDVGKRGGPTLNVAISEKPKTSRLFVTDIVILSPSRDKKEEKYGNSLPKYINEAFTFLKHFKRLRRIHDEELEEEQEKVADNGDAVANELFEASGDVRRWKEEVNRPVADTFDQEGSEGEFTMNNDGRPIAKKRRKKKPFSDATLYKHLVCDSVNLPGNYFEYFSKHLQNRPQILDLTDRDSHAETGMQGQATTTGTEKGTEVFRKNFKREYLHHQKIFLADISNFRIIIFELAHTYAGGGMTRDLYDPQTSDLYDRVFSKQI
ncbi:hypothetical protein WN51_01294 [Melipona quadrifasciata]|uniref:Uncharacterized protein n=1 Tax=Melipona quadrifasciata TaxID=166423 RepID=A0A0N0U4U9_9HYME|nr:hypothetical protein WN51_01294 [Melipona quadrifasciata]